MRDGDVAAAVVGEDLAGLTVLGAQGVPDELDVLLRAASSELQIQQAAADAGLSAGQVAALTSPVMPSTRLLQARPTGEVPPELLVLVFAFLFYLSVLTFGMSIAQSVVEEKQSRVIELLVAALPVRWLLAGKVIGNTVMALGQIVVILGAGLAGATVAGQGEIVRQVLGASGWFVAFFLLGFVMLACLWAVAGSLASRIEDLQATTVVMQVLVIVPFFAALFTLDPGPLQRVLSYVPFTAPLLMPARVVLGNAAPWEPVVSALIVLATGIAFVLIGAQAVRGLAAAHLLAPQRAPGVEGFAVSAGRIGTPLSPGATRALLLGGGELGKEVAIELQRLGVEVVVADRYARAPAMQVAHRSPRGGHARPAGPAAGGRHRASAPGDPRGRGDRHRRARRGRGHRGARGAHGPRDPADHGPRGHPTARGRGARPAHLAVPFRRQPRGAARGGERPGAAVRGQAGDELVRQGADGGAHRPTSSRRPGGTPAPAAGWPPTRTRRCG